MVSPCTTACTTEATLSRDQRFARADADASGGLDRDEFARVARKAAGPAGASANPAGATAQSAALHPEDLFSQIDTDQNGALSEAELEAARPRQPFPGARLSGDLLVALFQGQERQAAQVEPTSDRTRQWLEAVQRMASPSPAAVRVIASA